MASFSRLSYGERDASTTLGHSWSQRGDLLGNVVLPRVTCFRGRTRQKVVYRLHAISKPIARRTCGEAPHMPLIPSSVIHSACTDRRAISLGYRLYADLVPCLPAPQGMLASPRAWLSTRSSNRVQVESIARTNTTGPNTTELQVRL